MKLDLNNLRFLSTPKNIGNSRGGKLIGSLYKSGFFRFTSAFKGMTDGDWIDAEFDANEGKVSFRLNGDQYELKRRGFWIGTDTFAEFAKGKEFVNFEFSSEPDNEGWFQSL